MREDFADPARDRRPVAVRTDRPLRVLIVDDNASILRSLQGFLGGLDDLEITCASNGSEAKRLAWSVRPDLMLVDFDLGDTNAVELLAALSFRRVVEQTWIVVMSGVPRERHHERLRAYGARGFIDKPLDFRALREDVEVLASRSGAQLPYLG